MKLMLKTQDKVNLNSQAVRDKVLTYLGASGYKLIENQDVFITFKEDEFSLRPLTKSDYYTKVKAGKFELIANGEETDLKLFYHIPIIFESVIFTLILGLIIYDVKAVFLGIMFLINFGCKMYYLKFNLLNDIITDSYD